MGKVAYQLDLPDNSQIHDVFHVSLLKKAHGNHWQLIPLPEVHDSSQVVEPEFILERRMVKRGNQVATQLLIQWKNSSSHDTTWEFALEIKRRFPTFSLKDKGFGEG